MSGYLRQKAREWWCWARRFGFGHEPIVHGGGGGWEVWSCGRCGAHRVGPLDFFNRQHHRAGDYG